MNAPLLAARAVRKTFGRTEALRGAFVAVESGEHVAITGPSGSGKSTLLHCLAGIIQPEAGDVTYDGRRLDELSESQRTRLRRRQFGIVLQFGQLVPELSAADNVALPLLLERNGRSESRGAALEWLERVGALGLADARPGELSGGELQRVAVARALVTAPRVVFADEPTGALDTVSGEELLDVLLDSLKEIDATLVMVTHNHLVAARVGHEMVMRDGVVL